MFLERIKEFMYTMHENVALLEMTTADVDIWYGALSGYYNQTLQGVPRVKVTTSGECSLC